MPPEMPAAAPAPAPAAPQLGGNGADPHGTTALEEAFGKALDRGGFTRGPDGKFQTVSISGRKEAAPARRPAALAPKASEESPAAPAPGGGAAPPEDSPAPSGEDEEQQGTAEPPGDDESSDAPIEPPASWSADKHELFASLPRDAQEYLAQRERERDVELRRGQNGSAEARKALEAERDALSQERQQLAQRAVRFTSEAERAFMAQWGHVQNYNELSPDDYVRFNQSLDAVKFEYQQAAELRAQVEAEASRQLHAWRLEQDRLYRNEMRLSDNARWQAHQDDLVKWGRSIGLNDGELAQASAVHLGILRDAKLYRESRKALEQARANGATTAAPARVQAPGAARREPRTDGVAAALMQRMRSEQSTGALEAVFKHALDKGNRHDPAKRNVR